jgi:Glycosyl transferase family 2
MRIVMTLLVRDEEDILDEQISFHLAAGVDFFVVTDHDSRDRTRSILERYEQRGVLHVLSESGPEKRQSEWVTRMARMAGTRFGADWVVNSDADEFWWPRGRTLKEALAGIPERFGVVHTFVRPFLPRPGDSPFAERLTVRLAPPAAINSPVGTFRVNTRLLHRRADDVVVGFGNATVRAASLAHLHGLSSFEVLHFPIRSFAQFERKFRTKHDTAGGRNRADTRRVVDAARTGSSVRDLYNEVCLHDDAVRRGLAEGSLATDTRLRDALRSIAGESFPPRFPPDVAAAQAGYAVDGAILHEGELVRLQRRADELAVRVARREGRR